MNRYHARPGWAHRRRLRARGIAEAVAEAAVYLGAIALIVIGFLG